MGKITDELWFKDPFQWYETEQEKYTVSIQMSENRALDIIAGLHDIYLSFKSKNMDKALNDLSTLTVLLIATTFGYSDEAIEELLVMQAREDMDEALENMLGESSNG
jgi:hypothetical protein